MNNMNRMKTKEIQIGDRVTGEEYSEQYIDVPEELPEEYIDEEEAEGGESSEEETSDGD